MHMYNLFYMYTIYICAYVFLLVWPTARCNTKTDTQLFQSNCEPKRHYEISSIIQCNMRIPVTCGGRVTDNTAVAFLLN